MSDAELVSQIVFSFIVIGPDLLPSCLMGLLMPFLKYSSLVVSQDITVLHHTNWARFYRLELCRPTMLSNAAPPSGQ
jgi:hypothetical protein